MKKNAIILAAGVGSRMIPIQNDLPKALLKVDGVPLIERLIHQLHEAGISDITVVVGFLASHFSYLEDKYQIRLVSNSKYYERNNLYSLFLVAEEIGNTFILPADIWSLENPFLFKSDQSWYLLFENGDLEQEDLWSSMTGIAYISYHDSEQLVHRLQIFARDEEHRGSFWEDVLYEDGEFTLAPKFISKHQFKHVDTFEDLRDLDASSEHLNSDVIDVICQTLYVRSEKISNIRALKKGMTNRSFLFQCQSKKYIMRIPGVGTDVLINRESEASVYRALDGLDISDRVLYMNPKNGYKLTEYLLGARNCDMDCKDDVVKCIGKLKEFHDRALRVEHEFDLFEQILFYEGLRGDISSVYQSYRATKERVFKLRGFIERNVERKVLTHVDAIPDNFLIFENKGIEEIRIIDWEYAGMQDPHVDIAMFCIYSLYSREQIDQIIDLYFENQVEEDIRMKIYAYIAVAGLLWSNWCEYKSLVGVTFGEYATAQYSYAEDYSRLVLQYIQNSSIS
ncbi:NTP transferase domain-containing protein [Streptococcus danieliae]|uniref:NTP transferase domain-containing protein n=1 Tax=Streptococcus danieliae TaxID=747656 RepID=UPI0021C9C23F|nr:NTP transferase domain-containing protein [Streptococcus danieliae]MCU0082025.1 NTP transferase domain-containing protein [Streptococcus danieliae]